MDVGVFDLCIDNPKLLVDQRFVRELGTHHRVQIGSPVNQDHRVDSIRGSEFRECNGRTCCTRRRSISTVPSCTTTGVASQQETGNRLNSANPGETGRCPLFASIPRTPRVLLIPNAIRSALSHPQKQVSNEFCARTNGIDFSNLSIADLNLVVSKSKPKLPLERPDEVCYVHKQRGVAPTVVVAEDFFSQLERYDVLFQRRR